MSKIGPLCYSCKHYHSGKDVRKVNLPDDFVGWRRIRFCDAFPDGTGIPEKFFYGGHFEPEEGDHGIYFEPENGDHSRANMSFLKGIYCRKGDDGRISPEPQEVYKAWMKVLFLIDDFLAQQEKEVERNEEYEGANRTNKIGPLCYLCKHYYSGKDVDKINLPDDFEGWRRVKFCDAFPDGTGIPENIFYGGHFKSKQGDHGIYFEPENGDHSRANMRFLKRIYDKKGDNARMLPDPQEVYKAWLKALPSFMDSLPRKMEEGGCHEEYQVEGTSRTSKMEPLCCLCKHYHSGKDVDKINLPDDFDGWRRVKFCDAFPDGTGIPEKFFYGGHFKSEQGDRGIYFEPKNGDQGDCYMYFLKEFYNKEGDDAKIEPDKDDMLRAWRKAHLLTQIVH